MFFFILIYLCKLFEITSTANTTYCYNELNCLYRVNIKKKWIRTNKIIIFTKIRANYYNSIINFVQAL